MHPHIPVRYLPLLVCVHKAGKRCERGEWHTGQTLTSAARLMRSHEDRRRASMSKWGSKYDRTSYPESGFSSVGSHLDTNLFNKRTYLFINDGNVDKK